MDLEVLERRYSSSQEIYVMFILSFQQNPVWWQDYLTSSSEEQPLCWRLFVVHDINRLWLNFTQLANLPFFWLVRLVGHCFSASATKANVASMQKWCISVDWRTMGNVKRTSCYKSSLRETNYGAGSGEKKREGALHLWYLPKVLTPLLQNLHPARWLEMIRKDEAGADCWGSEREYFRHLSHSLTHSLTLSHSL